MSDWREVVFGEHRMRWRDGEDHYRLQYWHPRREEWRDVNNVSSRDWFAMGVQAGIELAEEGRQGVLDL